MSYNFEIYNLRPDRWQDGQDWKAPGYRKTTGRTHHKCDNMSEIWNRNGNNSSVPRCGNPGKVPEGTYRSQDQCVRFGEYSVTFGKGLPNQFIPPNTVVATVQIGDQNNPQNVLDPFGGDYNSDSANYMRARYNGKWGNGIGNTCPGNIGGPIGDIKIDVSPNTKDFPSDWQRSVPNSSGPRVKATFLLPNPTSDRADPYFYPLVYYYALTVIGVKHKGGSTESETIASNPIKGTWITDPNIGMPKFWDWVIQYICTFIDPTTKKPTNPKSKGAIIRALDPNNDKVMKFLDELFNTYGPSDFRLTNDDHLKDVITRRTCDKYPCAEICACPCIGISI